MSCNLTQGFEVGCGDGVGGVVEFLIGNHATQGEVTVNASGMVSAIAGSAFMYSYEAEKATSTLKEVATVSRENGTTYYDQTATYILNKTSQEKRNEIRLLAQARLSVIVKDKNGKYWLMGEEAGIRLLTGEADWGTAMADRNGYTLNFAGERERANERS